MSRFLTDTLDGIEITRAKDVAKHGEHDQSEHGNWARGIEVAPEIVRSTLERVKANGGLSVNLKDGSEPTKGFMVAKGKKYAAIVKADDFFDETKGAEILSSYMKRNKADLATGKNYLGLWHNQDDGQVYLDVSENIMDENEATSRGRDRDQISIWDVANFKEIQTGGTGGIEKTRGSRTARFVTDDRRTDRRLRQRNLGEVSKTLKVIYFDFGLKPVFKHEGHEDQSSHGNWATGRSEEDVKRISEMKDKGPALKALDDALDNATGEIDKDKATMLIDNERSLNDDIEQGISDLIANLEEQDGEPMSDEARLANYDSFRDQVMSEYIEENADALEEYARDNNYGSLKDPEVTADLRDSMNEVFGLEYTTEKNGNSITMRSEVSEVYVDGDGIHVKSDIFNQDGEIVSNSPVHRVFSKDEASGTWSVEHKLLEIDGEYRGLGFGGKFLQQTEDWYIAKGLTHITLNAGLTDGARHWATAGFDWNRDDLSLSINNLRSEIETKLNDVKSGQSGFMTVSAKKYEEGLNEAKTLLGRMTNSDGSIRDMREEDFPKPADFAKIGSKTTIFTEDGTKTWAGKEILRSTYLPYVKFLTAEGSNLLAGPIDMDGDGLVYDGTPREKPVSSSGKN
jgi:GNAT superfamily N-acetyltransferase